MVEGHGAVHEATAGPSAPERRPLSRSAPMLAAPLARLGGGALRTPEAVLALQRAAGNRTVARALERSERVLARCAGRCRCGGECGEEELVPDDARRAPVLARVARGDPPSGSDAGPSQPAPDASSTPPIADDGGVAPDNPSHEQDPSVQIGVCGPDVSTPLRTTLGQMGKDFAKWSPSDRRAACKRVLYPLDLTGATVNADLNGWDIHALFLGEAQWLRRAPVCPPCATPSSSAPGSAGWTHKGHEDPRTCSDTVQVGNACWLAGTPNYGAFGMILRLCEGELSAEAKDAGSEWPQDFLEWGKSMIRGYKTLVSKEDPKWPLAWTEAVYRSGPAATLPGGNRQSCTPSCSKVNPKLKPELLANWDYVWEPVHPRLKIAPAAPAPGPSDAGAGPPAPASSGP